MTKHNFQATITSKLLGIALLFTTSGITHASPNPLGAAPSADMLPKVEFVFEERVTVGEPIVLGDTALGHRQFIPITGGKIAGPKLTGEVMPGGWDFQLWHANGCGSLSADYFLRADDGTIIHILNESFDCNPKKDGERSFFRPRLEAPKGKYEWMTSSTFVATLELEMSPADATAKGGSTKSAQKLEAVRIKFYQIK
jgi:hypothetical protein